MTWDDIVAIVTAVLAGAAFYLALRKQPHEESNLDADTIGKLYDTIAKQEKRYNDLRNEFEAYKLMTNGQIASIAAENVKLRRWTTRLCAQLERAKIVPEPCE